MDPQDETVDDRLADSTSDHRMLLSRLESVENQVHAVFDTRKTAVAKAIQVRPKSNSSKLLGIPTVGMPAIDLFPISESSLPFVIVQASNRCRLIALLRNDSKMIPHSRWPRAPVANNSPRWG